MEFLKKKNEPSIKRKKPYGLIAGVAAAAVVLAVMPGLARREQNDSSAVTSFQATGGVIETSIHAGGTLTDLQAESISIPEGIELELEVKNGQHVAKGDLIATADKTGVMQAIAALQEKLDEIDKEIDDAIEAAGSSKLKATASGRIKAIYAAEGEKVTDIMHQNGALALLSLDGHMAVDVTCPGATVGMQVDVVLSNGEAITGTVAALSGDEITVTISDTSGELDEQVTVQRRDGTEIGKGKLYIYSQLAVTGYYGTIDRLRVKLNDWVNAGSTIAELSDVGASAGYAGLLNQRKNMEEQLQSLFELYQTGGIYAKVDGYIAELNEDDFEVKNTNSSEYTVVPMANSPTGSEGFTNYAAKVTGMSGNSLNLMLCPIAISEIDYANVTMLENMPYTEVLNFELPEGTAIYSFVDGAWTGGSISTGNYLIFAFTFAEEGPKLVWVVSHSPVPEVPEEPVDPEPEQPDVSDSDVSDSDVPEQPGTDQPGADTPVTPGPSIPNIPGITIPDFVMPEFDYSVGDYAGMFGGTMIPDAVMQEESKWLLKELDVCSVTADTDMTVTLSIDESDLAHISSGMEVQLELDAMPGELFTAVVTGIADSSETEFGSAKYVVEVTLDRTEQMRAGMNAAITVPVGSYEVECAVPLAALTEQSGQTIVYTAYNEDDGVFEAPVVVTTGVSDGNMVEILTGIAPGDTVYYEYVEVMEYSFI